MTPDETVTEFIRRIVAKDVDGAFDLCTDDLVYDNVPMPDALAKSKEEAIAFLAPFVAGATALEWVVHRQAATGSLVLNERTDRFQMGDTWIEIPVAGVFELRDGKIALWRDYFDLGQFQAQMQ